jgi:hypothetical protein
MKRRTIFTKTGKGLMEATGKTSDLSRDLLDILKEIDGKIRVSALLRKIETLTESELVKALRNLEREGYVREFIGQQDEGPGAPVGHPPAPQPSTDSGDELDFTDFTPAKPSAKTSEDTGPQALPREIAREAQARAQAEALDRARREAEERQRREAEEKAQREAEARARIDAEQFAKREAEERDRSEADEKIGWGSEGAGIGDAPARVSREAEERARREEAERMARIQAETRVKVEAEMRARREFEDRARREEEERVRREAELRRLVEEEAARKRRDAEESDALMRSLREQEGKAQQEAEQRERAERERREQEERARRESEEEARRKEEEKRAKEEQKRAREEEKAQADAEAREATQSRRAARAREREDEESARSRQEAARDSGTAGRRIRARRKPGSFVRQLAVMLLVLLAVSIAVIPFVPLESGPYEKAAQAWLGEPVKIGTFKLTLLPVPRLKFEKVVIGKEPQMRVATIRATPEIGSVLAEKKTLKRLELENVTFPREYLSALLRGKGKGESLGVEHLSAKGLKLDIPELNLPVLELDASFAADGTLKSVTLAGAERGLSVKLQPQGGRAAIEISSDTLPLPIGADLALEKFAAKGTVTRNELVLNEAEARAFGGRLLGSARLRWTDGWNLDGEIAVRQMDAARIAAPLVAGGTLEGRGAYSMKAPLPERLLMNARLEGNFTVRKGSITNVDMARLLQGSGSGGGTTPFSEMSGAVSAGPNRVLVRQIRLVSGLLNAAGQVEMDPQKNLSGRVQIELRAHTVQARATLAVAGTLKNPQFRRTN